LCIREATRRAFLYNKVTTSGFLSLPFARVERLSTNIAPDPASVSPRKMPLDAYCRPQRGACFSRAADRRPGRVAVGVAGATPGDRRDATAWYGNRSGSFVGAATHGAATGVCDAEILSGRHGNDAFASVFSIGKNDDDPANSPRKGK
jgi:hypothetical protein